MDPGKTTLTPAAQRVLDVAAELFYDNGIHAVGVDLIAAEAGVTKKTLYERFGSKDALVEAYLRRRDTRWREHVRSVVDSGRGGVPSRKPLLVFDALREWMSHEHPRGCAFVNAFAELADADHPARQAIRDQKQWLLDYIHGLAREAGLRNARRLAEELFILLEGASTVCTAGGVPAAVGRAKRIAKTLVEAARPE